MFKNGLFLMSLGFLLFVYSANAVAGTYNWPNLIFSLLMITLGGVVAYLGHKRDKRKEQEHGSK